MASTREHDIAGNYRRAICDSRMHPAPRVLMVDDSTAITAYLRSLLQPLFYHLEEVHSAEEAIDRLAMSQPFQVILLDIELPGMSGLEFLVKLREVDQKTAVVMLTSRGSIRIALGALEAGADGFIEKQEIFVDEFAAILRRAIERREGILARQQLEQLRSDFYAAITHDLRSPVGNSLMAVELLESTKPLTGEQEELTRMLRSSLERAMHLIERYLDYEKINSGFLKLDIKLSDLTEVVQSAVKNAKIQAMGKRQEISFKMPDHHVMVRMDAERMIHVIENLVSNAVRYTPPGGHIDIALEEKDTSIVLGIKDDGIGIKPEDQKKIFQKFERVDTAERVAKGTGLGLLITKEIVEGHGGTITVQSSGEPGKGTLFMVSLARDNVLT